MGVLSYQVVLSTVALVVAFSSVISEPTKCQRYCDEYGRLRRAFECTVPRNICCGSRTVRYCCNDTSRNVDSFPTPDYCVHWLWMAQWRIIIGLLASLVIMLLFAACCYYCCGPGYPSGGLSRGRSIRSRRVSTDTGSGSVLFQTDQSRTPGRPSVFDPDSPNAFTPPSYESLSKEPPKYAELFDPPTYSGQENPTFVGDSGQGEPPNRSIPLVTAVLAAANKSQKTGENSSSQNSAAPENISSQNSAAPENSQSSNSSQGNVRVGNNENTTGGTAGQSTADASSTRVATSPSQTTVTISV